jgi:hypothetical protein
MPLLPLGSEEVPRSRHLSTFCAWNWGPQPQLVAASNGGYTGDVETMRGRYHGRMVTGIAPQQWILFAVGLRDAAFLVADGPDFM